MITWIRRWYDRERALAAALLLQRMSDGGLHGGYELSRQKPKIRMGMVYPALRRLEELGRIEGVWETETGDRPPRKLYRRTP